MDPLGATRGQRILLLDVNNVLFAEPIPPILETIAAASDRSLDSVTRFYADTLRVPLWSGSIDEPRFWSALLTYAGVPVDPQAWGMRLRDAMKPLPAVRHVAEWAAATTIWLFSNQRSEWVESSLERLDLARFVDRSFVSSMLGGLKPDRALFAHVRDAWPGGAESVLFVDDQQANLDVGRELGFQTLHADSAEQWISAVDRWARFAFAPEASGQHR